MQRTQDARKPSIDLDETAGSIDNENISLGKFLDYYYTQNRIMLNMTKEEIEKLSGDPSAANHPTLSKPKFMDFLVSRKLILKKSENDKALNEKELKTVTELFQLQGISTYYLTEKLKDEITVTDDEIGKFYAENPKVFKGVPINDEVINRIRQQLFMQKFEQKSSEFVMNLIAESLVNREGFRNHLNKLQETKEKSAAGQDKKAE
jgi:hypothetical protein